MVLPCTDEMGSFLFWNTPRISNDGRKNCGKGGKRVSQRLNPEEITINHFYDNEISVQAAFQPVLEASIMDAAKKWLDRAENIKETIQ